MKLDQSLAVDVSCPSITRLRYNASKAELSAWKDVANTLGFTLERILQLRSESFWSTVVHKSEVMKAVDEIVEALPRRFEHDEYRLVFGWDPSIRETASRLYYSTFALFLRLAVFNKKADPTMSEKEFVEVVRGRSILSTRRFAVLCSLFSEHWQIVSEVVKTYSAMDKRFWSEMGQLLNELGQSFEVLEVENVRVTSEFYKRYGAAKTKAAHMIDEWLCSALALSQEGMVFVDILSQGNEALKEKADCVARVPAFVEFVDNTFTTEFIFDVAALISDYPLRRLSRLRAQLCQSAVAMYRNVLVRMNQDTRTCMVQSILENQRFVYLLNEVENLSELLKNCEKTSRDYVERAVESACVEETRKAVVELEKCGLLKGLGDVRVMNTKLREAVEDVQQIFPHLSLQYIHLCLRHFGYDSSKTIDALLARDDKLPMILRRVETAELTQSASNLQPTLPAFSFQSDDLLSSALSCHQDSLAASNVRASAETSEVKNVFKGLISLAPGRPSMSSTTNNGNEKVEKPANEVLKMLRETLKSLKLRVFEEQTGIHGERLVPMANSKSVVGVQKFKVSEADKIAIRPTYEKYRYETAGDDDDVYDDEYDDGYEHKEFTVEPLNAQTSSDESDEESGSAVEDSGKTTAKQSGKRGGTAVRGSAPSGANDRAAAGEAPTSRSNYTGGRQRQMKERHKNAFKQRGADRKMRGAY